MEKDYLKNSNQLGAIATEMLLLNKKELIENILSGKEKEEIFEKAYQRYKENRKNIISEFYSNDFSNIVSDLNTLTEYFKGETNITIETVESLNDNDFVNDAFVYYSLEIAKRERFGEDITIKELYNFIKDYNDNDEIWENFYDFLKENEIKRIKETAESIAEEVKYLLETDVKVIPVSEMLEEKKEIFNSENKNFVIISKENGNCKENSVLDEIFSVKEFNREKTEDKEILNYLKEALEKIENI